jgi:DNA polymerase-3 subunit beta
MRFTVSKSAFINKLTPAMGTVSNKGTITAIEGVLIETLDDGKIRISTYDMTKGVRSTLEAISIEREGKYIINAQRLYQTVRVMPEDEVVIDVNDKLNCTVSSGKASFSMFAMRGDEFPNLPELSGDRGFMISSAKIRLMIGKVAHSIAEMDNRPMLCGAYFKVTDGNLEVVSCDSYTLSRCSVKCDITSLFAASDIDFAFIIPGHALSELSKNLAEGDEEDVEFYISRKHAIIKKGDSIFFTRTIDSEYIDYNRITPKDNDITVVVDRERFLDGLERANIVADEKIKGSTRSYVKLTTDDQFISITSASVNGRVSDEMECVHEGRDIEIGFNCRYLINSVKVAEGENIKITLKSPTQAITIEPAEEDDEFKYFYMILPVRMNEQK